MDLKNPVKKGKAYVTYIKKVFSKAEIHTKIVPRSGAGEIKGDLWVYKEGELFIVAECKKQEKLNIWKAIQQAKLEAGYKNWAVVFSRNREEDYICMSINDFLGLIQKEEQK